MIRKVRPLIPYFTALYMALLVAGRTYVSKWRYAGARELARLVAVCAVGALITIGLNYAFHWCISRMVLAMAGMFVAAFVGGSRFMWKICREALLARRFKSDERVLIVGAGEAGVYAAKLCQEGRGISGTPVGFVSDEADMRGERLYDLPVLGDTGDIPSIIQRRDVTQIVIAMPDTDGERIADIVDACRRTRCKVRILRTWIRPPPESPAFCGRSTPRISSPGARCGWIPKASGGISPAGWCWLPAAAAPSAAKSAVR